MNTQSELSVLHPYTAAIESTGEINEERLILAKRNVPKEATTDEKVREMPTVISNKREHIISVEQIGECECYLQKGRVNTNKW